MNPNVNAAAAFSPKESSFSASASSPSAPAVGSPPAELSDAELLAATRRLVGRSNRLLATLLAHLAEVEARGIHRTRACSSLYTYCIYELRFSEDEAFRRVSAARLVRRFPLLLDAVATGELHLTAVLMLGPHLTTENLVEVLARAKHRTKKEIARLVRMLDPLPEVPPRIDPLGPEPAQLLPRAPSWSGFVGSMNPTRELAPGNRPHAWNEGKERTIDGEDDAANFGQRLGVNVHEGIRVGDEGARLNGGKVEEPDGRVRSQPRRAGLAPPLEPAPASLARAELAPPDEPGLAELALTDRTALERAKLALTDGTAPTRLARQRYRVQFTAGEEHVQLVEKAKALLSHSAPRAGLDEIHLHAMRALVAELERQRYAVTVRPQPRAHATSTRAPTPGAHQTRERVREDRADAEPKPDAEPEPDPEPALESASASAFQSASAFESASEPEHHAGREKPRWRGRYVPAAVRRAVLARDQGRCTYTSDSGQRCRETNGLELHHSRAFARGGEHSEENLTLRCRAHNDLAAEKDFGRGYIAFARDSTEHELWATHEATGDHARASLR